MGMYDSVTVPCPSCAEPSDFQSKSGPCRLDTFTLDEAPDAVLEDVNRHAPTRCLKCGTLFHVELTDPNPRPRRTLIARAVIWKDS